MKQYIKNNQVKARQDIVIVKDGMRTINPTEEMILAYGWVEYVPSTIEVEAEQKEEELNYAPLDNTVVYQVPEVSDKAAFVRARHKLRNKIKSYDSSLEVNLFYVGDKEVWLDKATRAGLLLRFQAEKAQGIEDTILWYNGQQFHLKVDQAIQMLYAIELYASACYDNTQRHLAAINKLKSIEEVEAYDYTLGYPSKLSFM
jgi:hypothetical protein